MKKLYVFHSVSRNLRTTSSTISALKRRGLHGCWLREHEPAERVRALVVEDVVGLHDVALALAHLLALAVEDVPQAEHALVGAAALDERGDGEQAVEPAAGLVDGLGR